MDVSHCSSEACYKDDKQDGIKRGNSITGVLGSFFQNLGNLGGGCQKLGRESTNARASYCT